MRFSAIAALCASPLALASVLEAEVLPRGGLSRRTSHEVNSGHPVEVVKEVAPGHPVEVVKQVQGGSVHVSATTIVIIWVNQGAGAPTETLNPTQAAPAATHTVSHPRRPFIFQNKY